MAKSPSAPTNQAKGTAPSSKSQSTSKENGKDAKAAAADVNEVDGEPENAGASKQADHTKSGETAPEARGVEKTAEQNAPTKKGDSQPWINQISLLLVGGILTVLGNAGVAWFNGRNAISVEREKAKSSLILQAIASSDANVSFRNIMFFVESRLIPDPDGSVVQAACKYLPVLPSVGAPPTQALTPADYESAFWTVTIDQDVLASINTAVANIRANMARFETVGQAVNTPWYVIGTIHWLEQRDRFDISLFNGKPIPAQATWEDDAIKSIRAAKVVDLNGATLGAILARIEAYNGIGFQRRGGSSPYLWGRTSGYTHTTTASALIVDLQERMARNPGAVAILRVLNEQSIIKLDDSGRRASSASTPSAPPDCAANASK